MSDGPRPCTAAEAVARATSMVGIPMPYVLGTGDYKPIGTMDLPWTTNRNGTGSDCAGLAICYAYKLPRHREGYNRGAFATVSDDINSNSAIEDAEHAAELFERVEIPELGALLAYPTIYLPGHATPWIGHVAIVVGVSRVIGWEPDAPDYSLIDVVQCCGPNGRKPAVIRSDASHWNHHDHDWPKAEHRTVMLRAIP